MISNRTFLHAHRFVSLLPRFDQATGTPVFYSSHPVIRISAIRLKTNDIIFSNRHTLGYSPFTRLTSPTGVPGGREGIPRSLRPPALWRNPLRTIGRLLPTIAVPIPGTVPLSPRAEGFLRSLTSASHSPLATGHFLPSFIFRKRRLRSRRATCRNRSYWPSRHQARVLLLEPREEHPDGRN